MAVRLSEKYVERLPFTDKAVEYYDSTVTGFGVRVGKRSKTYFVFGRLPGGADFKHKLGRYGIVDFSDAQDEAKNVLRDAAKGIHPKNRPNVLRGKIKRSTSLSLESLLDEYILTRKTMKERTKTEYKEWLERNVPDWLKVHAATITPAMVLQRHAEIGKRSPAQANGSMRIIRAVYNYAMEVYEEDIPRNPVRRLSSLKAWYRIREKTGYLRPSQLPAFFAAIDRHPCIQSDYLVMLLFTGIRSESEMAALKVADVDFSEQTIMLWDTKNKTDLYVPVCDTVKTILERRVAAATKAKTEFVFYSKRNDTGHIGDIRNKIKTIFKGTELKISPHDMRRTWITYAEELEIPKLIRQRLVGHEPTEVHDRYTIRSVERLRPEVAKVERFILEKAERDVSSKE